MRIVAAFQQTVHPGDEIDDGGLLQMQVEVG